MDKVPFFSETFGTRKLRAGALTMEYKNGFLRHICLGSSPVIGMIYFALRDANWNTLPIRVLKDEINDNGDSFAISFEGRSLLGASGLHWKVELKGYADNRIDIILKGTALTSFKKNRCGFCVHLPVKENRDKSFSVVRTKGEPEMISFPDRIRPDVICTNIAGLRWNICDQTEARLDLQGDLFEMEDQRNWADYSFKIYGTPLRFPFPVWMQAGDQFSQSLRLSLQNALVTGETSPSLLRIITGREQKTIPRIGVSGSSRNSIYKSHEKIIRSIGFDHYRIEIHFINTHWQPDFKEACSEAIRMKLPAEIVLFLSPDFSRDMADFLSLSIPPENISHFLLLSGHSKCSENAMLKTVYPLIKKQYSEIPVGAGTDAYFAELNRSSLDAQLLDFVSYSVNPQVHATDQQTIIENLPALRDGIRSARNKFPGKKIQLSPVTLKMRYNADATEADAGVTMPADSRQKNNLGAGWLLGSLKQVMEEGADWITYFETVGEGGLLETDSGGRIIRYPVLSIFKTILNKKWKSVITSNSSNPKIISSLVLTDGKNCCILLASYSDRKQKIHYQDSERSIYFTKTLLPWQIYCRTTD